MVKFKFSNIRSNNLIGKLIRFPLSLLPKTSVFPIMQGPAKGMKWVVGSGVHGMWLGSYEADKQQLLSLLNLTGTIVLDIGANVGFFSILLSRLVGEYGQVIAVEPLPSNIDYIEQHIKLNKIKNVKILSKAMSEKIGIMRFTSSIHNAQGRLTEEGNLKVLVTTLDSLDNLSSTVSLVKIDVEGAEADVLKGGEIFFKTHRPIILLATHGKKQAHDCEVILESYGYRMEKISQDLYGLNCDEWLAKPNE